MFFVFSLLIFGPTKSTTDIDFAILYTSSMVHRGYHASTDESCQEPNYGKHDSNIVNKLPYVMLQFATIMLKEASNRPYYSPPRGGVGGGW